MFSEDIPFAFLLKYVVAKLLNRPIKKYVMLYYRATYSAAEEAVRVWTMAAVYT